MIVFDPSKSKNLWITVVRTIDVRWKDIRESRKSYGPYRSYVVARCVGILLTLSFSRRYTRQFWITQS